MTGNNKLLKELEPVAKGEKVIGPMNEAVVSEFMVLSADADELRALVAVIQRRKEVHDAKRTLFWENVKKSLEQADSADARGLSLGVRKTKDGKPVVVEFKAENSNPLKSFFEALRTGQLHEEPENPDDKA